MNGPKIKYSKFSGYYILDKGGIEYVSFMQNISWTVWVYISSFMFIIKIKYWNLNVIKFLLTQ